MTMTIISQSHLPCIPYGCDEFGRLEHVMMHPPGDSLKLVNEENRKNWHFEKVPDAAKYNEEHERYRKLLESRGVIVHFLSDHVTKHRELMNKLPNLTFLHDIAVVSRHGAILSRMAISSRKKEDLVISEALEHIGIPLLHEFSNEEDAFEDLVILDEQTAMVLYTERRKLASIWKVIDAALAFYENIIFVVLPKTRQIQHPDAFFNRSGTKLALVYPPAFKHTSLVTKNGIKEIDFMKYMAKRGMELITVTDQEQQMLACSFVALENGVIFHYDTALDSTLRQILTRKGIELILFHSEAMLAGGGSLRSHTLLLSRTRSGISAPETRE